MKLTPLILLIVLPVSIFCQAFRNDVVIDEIMSDPSPQAQVINGLPEVEFVELRNMSQKTFNLNGWRLSDASTTATITTNFMLMPDSFVVIASVSAAAQLSSFGRSIGVTNFPSLDNDGELIYLTSKEGRTISAVEYKSSWFQNAVKSNGGWTLEMIDTKNCCSGASNWIASENPVGGTPGKKNSVDGINKDNTPPSLLRSYATDSVSVTLVFDEPLDSSLSSVKENYYFTEDTGAMVAATSLGPIFTNVLLKLRSSLKREMIYSVTAKKVTDCSGNEIGSFNNTKVGLPSEAGNLDVVINEILFNPKSNGVDFVEIYNRSKKIIDLKDLYLGNRAINGSPGSLKQLSVAPRLLFPGDYLTLTENPVVVKQQYLPKDPNAFLELSSLPSYPDDKGVCLIFSGTGKLIDEVDYSEKWHFKLIDDDEGVSLERIDYNKPSMSLDNWHSASTNSGYGTPGYQNSQFKSEPIDDATLSISPPTFSPDNDGRDDFITVTYRFPEPGYVCNISFYDMNGRAARYLVKNAICGLSGYFRWDGLDDKNNRLPVGIYVMVGEIFNLKGKTKKFRNGIILARKL